MTEATFDQFVAARYASLMRAAFVLTGDRFHAEDLVQSALLRAYPAWHRGEPEHPDAYVRAVMVRLAMRWRRRKWSAEVPTGDLPESGGDTSGQSDLAMTLHKALQELSLDHRAVLVLRHLAQMSEVETARALGCSVGTVKSRNSRALAALRVSGLLEEGLDA